MHSIGLYSQNDGNKAETFESGGVLYDHDISDDEDEGEDATAENEQEEEKQEEDEENNNLSDEEVDQADK